MGAKKGIALIIGIALTFGLAACAFGRQTEPNKTADTEAPQEQSLKPSDAAHSAASTPDEDEPKASTEQKNALEEYMHLFIGSTEISVEWEDNESVNALIELVKAEPLIIDMSTYGGFEQVGALGTSLPRDDKQMTAEAGDVVLYSGNRLVIFYGSNSWAYTRLGRVADKTAAEMAELLGSGNVTITISYGG